MFEHQLVGRRGFFVSVLVLANACGGGEISDARLGPEASDPEVSSLVCAGASPGVIAQGGWRSSEASQPAVGALRFELRARPTAANLNGLVAIGAEDIDDFPKAAIAVRFADNGLVDVRDGAFYSSDLAYPYDPGVWYSIAISADIDAETYDVEIGPCGEARKTLINDASFRDSANVSGQLSAWGVWSSQAAALEVSTPAWMDSEGCAPATCLALGHLCGTPQDGCGGVLSCGVCGDGETCSGGTCVAPGSNWWETVTRPDATNTGPNNPGLLGTGTPPPDTITQDGATYENFSKTGCTTIEADNVTLRNFTMDVSGCFTGIRLENGVSGALIEYGEVDGNNTAGDCLRGLGATIRYMNVHSCDDSHKAQGFNMGPMLVEHSYYWDNDGGHGDAVQSYEKSNNVTFRYNHLVGGRTSAFIMNEPPDPGYEFLVQNNWINGDGQAFNVLYCGGYGEPVKFFDNLFGRDFKGNDLNYNDGPCNWSGNLYWDDFSPVPHPDVWSP